MPACRIPAASVAAALACTLLLALLAAPMPASAAGAPAARASTAPAATEPLRLPTVAPPELIALTERMEQVAVTTERTSIRTALVVQGHSKEAQLLRALALLFDYSISGEFQVAPPAGDFTAQLLGAKLHFIVVDHRYYLYGGVKLAHHDHGRPWVALGTKGLGGLLTGGGSVTGSGAATKSARPSEAPYEYRKLARLLRSPESVTALGAGVIDGVPVQGFREQIAASAFSEGGEVSGLAGAFSAAVRKPAPAPAPVAPPVSAEVFIAADGRPVRLHLDVHEDSAEEAVLVDNYAIDFPLDVKAPPASETITLAELQRLGLIRRASTRVTGNG